MTAPPPDPERKHKTWAEREAATKARVEQAPVDFSIVPPSQWEMHDRLLNWSRWCDGRSGRVGEPSPMFALHRSDQWERHTYGAATEITVDKYDAVKIAKGIANPTFPVRHRKALNWYYRDNAWRARDKARELAVSLPGLAELVREGRLFLINRGV